MELGVDAHGIAELEGAQRVFRELFEVLRCQLGLLVTNWKRNLKVVFVELLPLVDYWLFKVQLWILTAQESTLTRLKDQDILSLLK